MLNKYLKTIIKLLYKIFIIRSIKLNTIVVFMKTVKYIIIKRDKIRENKRNKRK